MLVDARHHGQHSGGDDGTLDVGVQHGHAAHGRTAEVFVNQPAPHASKVGHDVLRHDDVVENRGRHGRLFEGLDGGLRCRERPTEAAHFGVHSEGRWSRFLSCSGSGSGSGRFGSAPARVRLRFWLRFGSVRLRFWLRFASGQVLARSGSGSGSSAPAQALVEDRRLEARWVAGRRSCGRRPSWALLGGPPGGPPGSGWRS